MTSHRRRFGDENARGGRDNLTSALPTTLPRHHGMVPLLISRHRHQAGRQRGPTSSEADAGHRGKPRRRHRGLLGSGLLPARRAARRSDSRHVWRTERTQHLGVCPHKAPSTAAEDPARPVIASSLLPPIGAWRFRWGVGRDRFCPFCTSRCPGSPGQTGGNPMDDRLRRAVGCESDPAAFHDHQQQPRSQTCRPFLLVQHPWYHDLHLHRSQLFRGSTRSDPGGVDTRAREVRGSSSQYPARGGRFRPQRGRKNGGQVLRGRLGPVCRHGRLHTDRRKGNTGRTRGDAQRGLQRVRCDRGPSRHRKDPNNRRRLHGGGRGPG